jgi:methyltransferase
MQEIEFKRYEEIGNWNFSDIKYTVEQNSDWDFYKEISKYSKSNSLILDLGTGGGEKALAQMPDVGMIIATDFSPKMIETANINKKNYPNKNIKFVVMDNLNMNFPNNLFDIVSARHTIINATQIYNCLSDNGILIIEGVDKYDCWELKKLFNRGQAFKDSVSISQKDYNDIKEAGFSEISLQEIVQYEYYKTENDLLALLIKTPILDDFSELNISNNTHRNLIEKELFKKYVAEHTTDKGIELKRILYGIIAKK